ncbi:hypothetical protein DFY76_20855 [Escherichia coli]|nr:hypothetical protein [Escherichia coli]
MQAVKLHLIIQKSPQYLVLCQVQLAHHTFGITPKIVMMLFHRNMQRVFIIRGHLNMKMVLNQPLVVSLHQVKVILPHQIRVKN